ncbi:unnamed protein product [Linum tenue]|uniref:PWWP domain-containing protein n=1 Tax=Linum tenue TaxID=586396 RepID=A0AAV0R6B7_9ROSI|nr:unnamed protein product [Linum tenue]
MGSSEYGALDAGVGPIVWVRRRNGSWWPGKILCPDELAECNLSSPRTGTPVKLLGRDDASVDWYNLEKSKRVKPFRCGDFDECIEKAESSHGVPIKKREKYARREDAILHALELEKELLKKQGKLGMTFDHSRRTSSGSAKKEIVTLYDELGNNCAKPDLYQFHNRVDVKDEAVSSPMHLLQMSEGNKISLADDHSDEMPRMRDLRDVGLRTAHLKRKLSSFDFDNRCPENPVSANSTLSTDNGVEQPETLSCAKRSKLVYFPTEGGELMDDKGLSSGQVKMFPIDVSLSQFDENDRDPQQSLLNEENSLSDFMEDVGHNSTESDSSESDFSATEPEMNDEVAVFSDGTIETQLDGLAGHGEDGTTSSEETDDSAFSGGMPPHYLEDHPYLASNETVSKWQLKGKRNTRNLTRKSLDRGNGKFSHPYKTKGSTLGSYAVHDDDDEDDDDDDDDDDEYGTRYFESRKGRLNDDGFSYGFQRSHRPNTFGQKLMSWDDITWEESPAFRSFWKASRGDHFSPFGGRGRSMLIDVDLKVKASYQKEAAVPIVSLRSKVDGRAIIGHPIQVEPLEYGSTDALLVSTSDHCSSETTFEHHDRKGDTAAVLQQPSWRTARRTNNFRVPRPVSGQVPRVGGSGRRGSTGGGGVRKGSSGQVPRPMRKVGKKKAGGMLSSNQKTRMLSSIGFQQRKGGSSSSSGGGSSSSEMGGGVMKGETSGLTTVACIPVKLVFSRLLEKINRPPSFGVK